MSKDFSFLRLSGNPFDARMDHQAGGQDRFIDRVRARELNRVKSVFDLAAKDNDFQRMWLIKDDTVSIENNIAIISKLFPRLVEDGYHCAYMAVPLIYQNPLRGFFQMITDKLQADKLQLVVYAYLKQKLNGLEPDMALSDGLTVKDVLADIATGGDEVLDAIFAEPAPAPLTGTDQEEEPGTPGPRAEGRGPESQELEQKAVSSEQRAEPEQKSEPAQCTGNDSEKDNDELDSAQEEETDDSRERLKESLISLMSQWLRQEEIEGDVFHAVIKSLTDGFEEGFSLLNKSQNYRENLKPLLKLLVKYFRKIVVVLDQLEGWEALDDNEQGKLLGAISEFSWTAGCNTVIVLACERESKDRLEKHIGSGETVELNLEAVTWFGSKLEPARVQELIGDFLGSDSLRMKDDSASIEPFTSEAVEWIASRDWPDLFAITEVLRNSLDYAAVNSIEQIGEAVLSG